MSTNNKTNESTTSSTTPRLGPTWRSNNQGRGFQPPPAVPASSPTDKNNDNSSNRNSFSLLDMDDDGPLPTSTVTDKKKKSPTSSTTATAATSGRFTNLRSSTTSGTSSSSGFSTRASKLKENTSGGGGASGSGRSLADLASRFTSASSSTTTERMANSGSTGATGGSGRSHSYNQPYDHHHRGSNSNLEETNNVRGSGSGGALSSSNTTGTSSGRTTMTAKNLELMELENNVVRFTRERLLSMRPRPDEEKDVLPESLSCLDGTAMFSKEALDPVCWDTFDANEIWARDRASRSNKQTGGSSGSATGIAKKDFDTSDRRGSLTNHRSSIGHGGDGDSTWQRGVALPPERRSGGSGRYDDSDFAENPDDLWDDPSAPSTSMSKMSAAADFSAFGGSLDDDPLSVDGAGGGFFNLGNLSEAARKFEEDFRSGSNKELDSGSRRSNEDDDAHDHAVNPSRPLASAGTTIRSGSGDHVNVFEDFGDPSDPGHNDNSGEAVKSGDAQSASSRLMEMIGVSNNVDHKDNAQTKEGGNTSDSAAATDTATASLFSFSSGVSKNPWGDPNPTASSTEESFGLDLAAKLRESTVDNQNDSDRLKREEMERMRLMEAEEEKRRAAAMSQQQAELLLRQQQQQKQSQQQGPGQVELILTERISTILENSWGRSDLISVLKTLHNEDSRVIQLLGSVDALRALVGRHPRRFALAKDPSYGTEMAVLLIDNATWQQQQQAEEMRRRQQEEHQKILAMQEAARIEAEKRAKQAPQPVVITDSPWYYADPQGNVQGPFGGEEMRQWLAAGYFKGNLPISQDPKGQFRPLASLFPDLNVAFKPTVPSKAEMVEAAAAEEAKRKAEAKAEQKRIEKEQVMVEKSKAEEATRAIEAMSLREQQESQSKQNQSAQLKMLLGLGGDSSTQSDKKTESQPPQSKISKATKDRSKANGAEIPVQAQPVPAPTPAWGGAGTNKSSVQKKSMSEIQQEEARVAARAAKQRPQQTGWANIAASGGTTAWSGNAAAVPSAQVAAPRGALPSQVASSASGVAPHSKQTAAVSSSTQNSKSQPTNSTQKTMEEFGADGKMTPALESWCKEQMRKLTGSDDLTLIIFCMTLSDPVEIKAYLTAYLGSTPQVTSFASEFINRKNGTKQQEQWETTGGSKKGRKKKGAVAK